MLLRALPKSERPRERLLHAGAANLSLRECIAVLIGTGTRGKDALRCAEEAIGKFVGVGPDSFHSDLDLERSFFRNLELELDGTPCERGVPDGTLARLRVCLEIARRYSRVRARPESVFGVDEPNQAREAPAIPLTIPKLVLRERAARRIPAAYLDSPTEWIGYVPVHCAGRPGGFTLVARGSRTRVSVSPADLFAPLLALRPIGFFLFHNHPSGDLRPSREDYLLTEKVASLARELQVPLVDHAIVRGDGARKWIFT